MLKNFLEIILNQEKWFFHFENGCLEHPCGLLTSWFRFDEEKNKWVVLELATPVQSETLHEILFRIDCESDQKKDLTS